VLIQATDMVDALVNPEPTGAKRLRWWSKSGPEARSVAGIDTTLMAAKYGPERAGAPRQIDGTFSLPLGTRWSTYERHRNECVNKFVVTMGKQGWDVDSSQRIQVFPGMYPAVDPTTNTPILDRREFIVRAFFRKHNPETIRLEIDPKWLEAVHA
jgi:hypothetical protein